MDKQKIKYIAIRTARYCTANILFVIVSFISLVTLYYIAQRVTAEVSEDVIRVFHIGLGLVTYHILHKAFIVTDTAARTTYYNGGDMPKFYAYLVKNVDAPISLLVTVIFLVFFPRAFLVNSLKQWINLPYAAVYAIVFSAFTLILLITWLVGLKNWRKAEKSAQKSKIKRKDNMILLKYIGSSLFTFPVLAYLLPIFFPSLRTLPAVIFTVGVVLVPIVLGLTLAFLSIDYIRALFVRFGFFRKLRKAAQNHGFTVSEISYPYSSVFTDHDGASFTIVANGKTYICKLLAGIHYGNPMYFEEEGKGVVVHHLSIRYRSMMAAPFVKNAMMWQKLPDDIAQFHTYFRYDFEGEGKKVLIVSPTPHSIYATGYGQNKLLDVGDVIYGYTLMTGTAFINALERDCL